MLSSTFLNFFFNKRRTLLSTLSNFNHSLLENTSNILTKTLRFENLSLSSSGNSKILDATIDFISSTKRFMNFFLNSESCIY